VYLDSSTSGRFLHCAKQVQQVDLVVPLALYKSMIKNYNKGKTSDSKTFVASFILLDVLRGHPFMTSTRRGQGGQA